MKVCIVGTFLFCMTALSSEGHIPSRNSSDVVSANILGGGHALPAEFPYYLRVTLSNSLTTLCGAVLVARYFALTAGHCSVKPVVHVVKGGSVNVGVGEKVFQIEEVHNHPSYRQAAAEFFHVYDVAILCLKTPVTYTAYLNRIHLPGPDSHFVNLRIAVVGAGLTSNKGKLTPVLKKYYAQVISLEDCEKLVPGFDKVSDEVSHGCYKTEVGEGGCDGDSGSPVVYLDRHTGEGYLVGIYAAGLKHCGIRASANVFTRVQAFLGSFNTVTNNFLRKKRRPSHGPR